MPEQTFFGKYWINKNVVFRSPSPSTWTIVKKLSERPEQLFPQHAKYPDSFGVSYTRAESLCQNYSNPSHKASLQIYKQVPHLGTKGDRYTERQKQARMRPHEEVEALQLFTRRKSKHMPIFLEYKLQKQDDHDLVPDGYTIFLMSEMLPSVRLNEELFMSLDSQEREAIRRAFKAAYQYISLPLLQISNQEASMGGRELYSARVQPLYCEIEHLLWNKEANTVYIIDFSFTTPMTEEDAWPEKLYAAWDLAIPPDDVEWWKPGYAHKGIDGWKL